MNIYTKEYDNDLVQIRICPSQNLNTGISKNQGDLNVDKFINIIKQSFQKDSTTKNKMFKTEISKEYQNIFILI